MLNYVSEFQISVYSILGIYGAPVTTVSRKCIPLYGVMKYLSKYFDNFYITERDSEEMGISFLGSFA